MAGTIAVLFNLLPELIPPAKTVAKSPVISAPITSPLPTKPLEEKETGVINSLTLPALAADLPLEKEGLVPDKPVFQYIEVVDSCNSSFEGDCLNARSGPGEDYPVLKRLRNGMVLKVADTIQGNDGRQWYKIKFDNDLLYPERVSKNWFVAADFVLLFFDEGNINIEKNMTASSTKSIVIDRQKQMLYAYEGDYLFMEESISTGLWPNLTPRGNFTIFKKTPSRYMQGPLPGISEDYYDLPGISWVMYFTDQGAAIHGTYWHNKFGQPQSHGCINVPYEQAQELYRWADLGTKVVVQD